MKVYKKIKSLFKRQKLEPFDKAIKSLDYKNLKFIQIGACDGKFVDPINKHIKKYNWEGVLVEPVPYYFEKLKETYKDSNNLTFVNKAISEKNSSVSMFTIDPSGFEVLPAWVQGISSLHLDRNAISEDYWTKGRGKVHLKDGYSYEKLKPFIKEIQVECITLEVLINESGISDFDLLLIDAEGHDYIILNQLDFKKYKPKIIQFEYVNLLSEEKEKIIKLLRKHNYKIIFPDVNNAIALLKI